jgi:hypothetical protein
VTVEISDPSGLNTPAAFTEILAAEKDGVTHFWFLVKRGNEGSDVARTNIDLRSYGDGLLAPLCSTYTGIRDGVQGLFWRGSRNGPHLDAQGKLYRWMCKKLSGQCSCYRCCS